MNLFMNLCFKVSQFVVLKQMAILTKNLLIKPCLVLRNKNKFGTKVNKDRG